MRDWMRAFIGCVVGCALSLNAPRTCCLPGDAAAPGSVRLPPVQNGTGNASQPRPQPPGRTGTRQNSEVKPSQQVLRRVIARERALLRLPFGSVADFVWAGASGDNEKNRAGGDRSALPVQTGASVQALTDADLERREAPRLI